MYRFTLMSGKWIGTKVGDDSVDAVIDLECDGYVFLDEGAPVMYVSEPETLDNAGIKYELT